MGAGAECSAGSAPPETGLAKPVSPTCPSHGSQDSVALSWCLWGKTARTGSQCRFAKQIVPRPAIFRACLSRRLRPTALSCRDAPWGAAPVATHWRSFLLADRSPLGAPSTVSWLRGSVPLRLVGPYRRRNRSGRGQVWISTFKASRSSAGCCFTRFVFGAEDQRAVLVDGQAGGAAQAELPHGSGRASGGRGWMTGGY
jgi:hypothetical protein